MKTGSRGVVIIGPAWDSSGTYQVFKSQIDACAATGAETYFLAVAKDLNAIGEGAGWWDNYLRLTPDLTATMRGEAKVWSASKWRPAVFFARREARRRTVSFWRTVPSRLAKIPASLRQFVQTHELDAIVCNHYFHLPIAQEVSRLAGGAKIICETHDIQSRHMIRFDPVHPLTGAQGDYESYFRDEIECCRPADAFIHLNDDECAIFREALPERKHHLIYPSLPRPASRPPGLAPDLDFLIVASASPPNYVSLKWFLEEVWDAELNAAATLRVVGNIDYMFGHDGGDLLERYGPIFAGRVEDLSSWYHRARTVLAPTVEGQGVSIKTIEALSYGRPFLYSPLALRGFANHPLTAQLAGQCSSAAEFREGLRRRLRSGRERPLEINDAGLELYEALFARDTYRRKFAGVLLGPEKANAMASTSQRVAPDGAQERGSTA